MNCCSLLHLENRLLTGLWERKLLRGSRSPVEWLLGSIKKRELNRGKKGVGEQGPRAGGVALG
jgi:hypothetical protein